MVVKAGYQQTEVGVIPEDWEEKTFVDVLSGFTSGQTPSRTRPEYFKGNIPWITSGELNHNIITDTIEKITPEAVKNTNLKIIPRGTFLFAITGLEAEGTRGSCAITGIDATTNQSCMALYPTNALTTKYLFYYYEKFGNWLAFRYCQGTKQQSYSGVIARKLPIIFPPNKDEQHAIATALSDADALITSLDQLIAKKRDLKQAAIQELLTGKRRLPGFSGEWEIVRLGDCLIESPQYGINAPAISYSDGLPPYIRITDITEDGRFSKENLVSVDSEDSANFYLNEGDIVFARTGASVGKSYLYDLNDGPLVFAGFLIRVRPNPKKILPIFLAAFVKTCLYWNWVGQMSMRSGHQELMPANIYNSLFHDLTSLSSKPSPSSSPT